MAVGASLGGCFPDLDALDRGENAAEDGGSGGRVETGTSGGGGREAGTGGSGDVGSGGVGGTDASVQDGGVVPSSEESGPEASGSDAGPDEREPVDASIPPGDTPDTSLADGREADARVPDSTQTEEGDATTADVSPSSDDSGDAPGDESSDALDDTGLDDAIVDGAISDGGTGGDAFAEAGALADPTPYLTFIPVADEDGGVVLGNAASNINAVSFRHNGLVSAGNYQFVAFYGLVTPPSGYNLLVGRRHTGASSWTLTPTSFSAGERYDRPSAAVQIGLDGRGVLHMSWGSTVSGSTSLYYTRSRGSALNDDPIAFVEGDPGDADALVSGSPISTRFTSDTTPQVLEFYPVPGSNDLLSPYRTGITGSGDYDLVRWDAENQVWKGAFAGDQSLWISGHDSTYGNPYINQLVFDSTGGLHASWTYRNSSNSANTDFFYARSADQGATWTSADGTTSYATPLTSTSPPRALEFAPLSSGSYNLINQCSMAVDTSDRPVVACWYAPAGTQYHQIMVLWLEDGQWRSAQVSARAVADSVTNELARPIILVDDEDRWIVVWRDLHAVHQGVKMAVSVRPARDDWREMDLTTDDLGTWEPVYDAPRWKQDRVLSLYYQACPASLAASPVSVLEFRVRDYFAADGGSD